jgi:hypothetical protein
MNIWTLGGAMLHQINLALSSGGCLFLWVGGRLSWCFFFSKGGKKLLPDFY